MPEWRASVLPVAYSPGNSFLHRRHPLVKLAWLLWGTVAVFAVQQPAFVLGLLALAALAAALAGMKRLRGLRLFLLTGLVLGLMQLIFNRDGEMLVRLGPLVVTGAGLRAAAYVAGRFWSVVLLSYLFVFTTDPNDLAYALMQAGLPYRFGFTLITALRLVPLFEAEGRTVYDAQRARGVAYDVRSPRRFVLLGRQFFLPLLVSALSKVDALAVSMEGRCFGKYPRRTFLREVRATPADFVALLALAAATAALALQF